MCEKKQMRIIFGTKRTEVTGGWTILHNAEFSKVAIFGHVVRMMEMKNAHIFLTRKPLREDTTSQA
jgi:hypothetical protein